MGFVGYRKNAWDAATPAQRAVLKTVINALELGDPVQGKIGGQDWYVFHDPRINPKFVENLAWFNTILASITTEPQRAGRDYATTEVVQVEVPVRIQVEVPVLDENGDPTGETVLVWQDHPTETQLVDEERPLGDVLTLAADAQGSVAWFGAATDLPASWTPAAGDN